MLYLLTDDHFIVAMTYRIVATRKSCEESLWISSTIGEKIHHSKLIALPGFGKTYAAANGRIILLTVRRAGIKHDEKSIRPSPKICPVAREAIAIGAAGGNIRTFRKI